MPDLPPHVTVAVRRVLRTLAADPGREWYAAQLGAELGLSSATLCGLLPRLARLGWITARWDAGPPTVVWGRPPRRFYRLVPAAVQPVRDLLEARPIPERAGSPAGDENTYIEL